MNELKPCDKCKKAGDIRNVMGEWFITCDCLHLFNSREEAIKQWNHRPFESHAVEVLAEKLYKLDIIGDPFYYSWENARVDHKEQHRAEAKQLLGLK